MTHERRRHPRHEVHGIVGALDQRIRFAVRVLSLGGMLVETTRELSPGDEGLARLELGDHGQLAVHSRVLYVGPTSSGAFRVGMAFETVSVRDRVVLEGFLAGKPETNA